MRPVTLRAALVMAAMFLPVLSLAEMPETIEEERTKATLPHGADSDQSPPLDLDDVDLNIIDHKLALSMAVDTWMQIEANQWALESVTSETVKQLLSARVESHRAFAERLEKLTDGRCGDTIAEAAQEIRRDAGETETRTVRFRPLALRRNATAMMVRIRLEILQQYNDSVQEELSSASAEEFDRQFLRADILHQMQLLAMLEVFTGQASADFARVIEHEQAAALEHLARSRQALVQLDAQPLAGASLSLPPKAAAAP